MNKKLKRVSVVVLAMFVALFVSSTLITGVQADSLRADSRNSRAILQSYSTQRGAILVDGKAVAESKPVDDQYKFQRTYSDGDLYSPVTGYYTLGEGTTGIENALNKQLLRQLERAVLRQAQLAPHRQGPRGRLGQHDDRRRTCRRSPTTRSATTPAPSSRSSRRPARSSPWCRRARYDPNALASHDRTAVLKAYDALHQRLVAARCINRAIDGDLYFPGSTFKLVVAAAAFESGNYTKDSQARRTRAIAAAARLEHLHQQRRGRHLRWRLDGHDRDRTASTRATSPSPNSARSSATTRSTSMAKKFGFDDGARDPAGRRPTSEFPDDRLDRPQLMLQSFGQGERPRTPRCRWR